MKACKSVQGKKKKKVDAEANLPYKAGDFLYFTLTSVSFLSNSLINEKIR